MPCRLVSSCVLVNISIMPFCSALGSGVCVRTMRSSWVCCSVASVSPSSCKGPNSDCSNSIIKRVCLVFVFVSFFF